MSMTIQIFFNHLYVSMDLAVKFPYWVILLYMCKQDEQKHKQRIILSRKRT